MILSHRHNVVHYTHIMLLTCMACSKVTPKKALKTNYKSDQGNEMICKVGKAIQLSVGKGKDFESVFFCFCCV
jgi:hypothetical protein